MSTLGSQQFLYPAKPYNEITPGGISSEQSLAMMNAASQRRAQFALQSNEQKHATQMQRERLDFETSQAEDDRNFQREIEAKAERIRQIQDQRRLLMAQGQSAETAINEDESMKLDLLDKQHEIELSQHESKLMSLMALRAFRDQGVSGEAWTQVMKGLVDKGTAADSVMKNLIAQKDDLFSELERVWAGTTIPATHSADPTLPSFLQKGLTDVAPPKEKAFGELEDWSKPARQGTPAGSHASRWNRLAQEVVLAAGGSVQAPGSETTDQLVSRVESLLGLLDSSLDQPAGAPKAEITKQWNDLKRSMNTEQLATALVALKAVSGAEMAGPAEAAIGASMKTEKDQPLPKEGRTSAAQPTEIRKRYSSMITMLRGITDPEGNRLAEFRNPGDTPKEQEIVKQVMTGIFTNLTSTKSLAEAINAMSTPETDDDPTYLAGWEKMKDPVVREYLMNYLKEQQSELLRLEQETGMTLETPVAGLEGERDAAKQRKLDEVRRIKEEGISKRKSLRDTNLNEQGEQIRRTR